MRNTLIILNYQREITPFMQNLIHYADKVFDKIIYFTPELFNDNRADCQSEKLEIIQCKRNKWRIAFIKAIFCCCSVGVIKQLLVAIRHHQSILKVYRQVFVHEVCSETLVQGVVERVKDKSIEPSKTVVLATWFATEAYANAKLKKRFPEFKTVSYAHSFEISTKKNKIMAYDMNEFKHKFCDEIVFISNIMRDLYFAEIQHIYPEITKKNTCVKYLGSQKRYPDSFCSSSTDNSLRILSCSSATPIKRVHLIIHALKNWNSSFRIEWTHIGGGQLLDELNEMARTELGGKTNVVARFLGSLSNIEVQQYYCSNPVDLFINVSEDEGLPVSIMECISYGVPAIATNVGGTSEIVTKDTGFLLDKDFSSTDLIRCIEEYINMPEVDRNKLRNTAFASWTKEFDSSVNSIQFSNWLARQK